MKTLIISFLVFCCYFGINAQVDTSFPSSWKGIWKGELKIYNAEGLAQSVPMELHILPTDSLHRYTWTIIYGADKVAGKRDYELVILDAANGKYAIDEKNSIQIEGYFFEDKFFSRFEVMGSMLLSSQRLLGNQLIFEIIAGKTEPESVTGNSIFEGDTIPPVKSFPIGVMQRAILERE